MEVNYEFLFCSKPAEEVALSLSALSVTAEEAVRLVNTLCSSSQ